MMKSHQDEGPAGEAAPGTGPVSLSRDQTRVCLLWDGSPQPMNYMDPWQGDEAIAMESTLGAMIIIDKVQA